MEMHEAPLDLAKNNTTVANACAGCISKNTGCCGPGKMPYQDDFEAMVSMDEIAAIKTITAEEDFYYEEDFYGKDNIYYVLEQKDNGECVFLENGKCSIYNHRPFDCRIFPFDFDVFIDPQTRNNKVMWFLWNCDYSKTIDEDAIEPMLISLEKDHKDRILAYLNLDRLDTYKPQEWPTTDKYRVLRPVNL